MKKKYTFVIVMLIAVACLSNIGIMGYNWYPIVMTQLYETYPEWAVNGFIAWPSLVGMVSCLLCGKIADKVDKKWLFITGMVLFLLSATNLCGLGWNSTIIMVICACFSGGVCYGMVSVPMIGIISDCFQEEEQRGTVMGVYNGAMAAVGAIVSPIMGFLAVNNWHNVVIPNWFTVVVIILAIIFIPACPPKKVADVQTGGNVKGEKGWAKRLIPIVLAFFFVSFAGMSVMMYVDLYITGNNLGTSALTGTYTSIQTVASFIACTAFGVTYKKLGNRVSIPGYLLITISILLMMLVPSKTILLISGAIFGLGWGTVYTYWFFKPTIVVPENMVGTTTGIITTANSLSYLPMPYFITGVMAAMGAENIKSIYPIFAGIVFVVFIGAIILNGKKEDA